MAERKSLKIFDADMAQTHVLEECGAPRVLWVSRDPDAGATWSGEEQEEDDVAYIRADLVGKLSDNADALRFRECSVGLLIHGVPGTAGANNAPGGGDG